MHPTIRQLHTLLDATPDNGEGSAFHLRSDYLWALEDDMRRIEAKDPEILSEFEADTFDAAWDACMDDARKALARWSAA